MFKENLAVVVDGWRKIRSSSMESRINLQGKGEKLSTLKSKVAAVKAKGSMTAQEKAEIDALKAELGVN
jgi:HAMP domain-containing protein